MLKLPAASIENNLLCNLETSERGLKYGTFRDGHWVLHGGLEPSSFPLSSPISSTLSSILSHY